MSRHAEKEARNARRQKGAKYARDRKKLKRERRMKHAELMARNDEKEEENEE